MKLDNIKMTISTLSSSKFHQRRTAVQPGELSGSKPNDVRLETYGPKLGACR